MHSPAPHYLRFVRTLALATTIALPACAGAVDSTATDGQGDETTTPPASAAPTPAPTAPTDLATTTTLPVPTAMATATTPPTDDMDAGAGDAYYGKSSGPLPPPEMPASLG